MTTQTQINPLEIDKSQLQDAIRRIRERALPQELDYWANEYAKVGYRNKFLWSWCLEGVTLTSLPCVDPPLRGTNNVTKVLGVIFDVLLDDIADRSKNTSFLERVLEIPFARVVPGFSSFSPAEQAYADLTGRVWNAIMARAQSCPRYDEFQELLRFDYTQMLNSMRYSLLVNRDPRLLNLVEHDLYLPHNMHMMVSGTLDLMCSPSFDANELGRIREVVWHAQCMGRVGNLVTTWEREIGETDWTSGVFARAIELGVISPEDLENADPEHLRAAIISGDCEAYFIEQWKLHHDEIESRIDTIHSVDVRRLLTGLEGLIRIHLGSRGLK